MLSCLYEYASNMVSSFLSLHPFFFIVLRADELGVVGTSPSLCHNEQSIKLSFFKALTTRMKGDEINESTVLLLIIELPDPTYTEMRE